MKRTALFFILLFATINLMASSGVVVLQRGDIGDGWEGMSLSRWCNDAMR